MDGDLYLQILKNELLETLQFYDLNSSNIIFQQDNDPKHTCKKVKEWLEGQNLRTIIWPAQSPDLSPIAHCWGYLKRKLAEYKNSSNKIYEP